MSDITSSSEVNAGGSIRTPWQIFIYFLRLGALGFGGPLAVVAQIQRDLVEKDQWLSQQEYNQTFAMLKAMPGPLAFMMSTHMGRLRAGALGGFLSAIGFVLPAFLMMLVFGELYSSFAKIESAKLFLDGMQASAIALIIMGLKGMIQSHYKKIEFWALAIFTAVLLGFHILPEAILILLSALIFILYRRANSKTQVHSLAFFVGFSPILQDLAWVSFKAGAFVFGTGLAIVPMLEADFVGRLHWLTHSQFLDALSFGQLTPGPVVITVTFIGYRVAGLAGAAVGTIAIFLPSFIHMMTWFHFAIKKMSQQKWISDFIFGASAAVVGAILLVVGQMTHEWTASPFKFFILAASILAVLKTKIPSWALLLSGGVANLVLLFVH